MKDLKEYFSGRGQVKGYVFNQISKTEYAYLYEVKGIDAIHYEVFKRVENTRYNCISYPSDKSFGVWAWTCKDLQKAKKRLNEITEKEKLKKIY